MDSIRQSPVSVLCIRPTAFDACMAALQPFIAKCPAGSQLIVVTDDNRFNSGNVRVVHQIHPLTYGALLQTALWSADTPLVLIVPGDESVAPKDIKEFFERIDGSDIVVGCRQIGQTPALVRAGDLLRRIMARIFLGYSPAPRLGWSGWRGWPVRWLADHVFGVPLADPMCGVLLARREIFDRIPIQSAGPFAHVEIVAKANHLGCLLDEVALAGGADRPAPFAADAWRLLHWPDFGPPQVACDFAKRTLARELSQEM